MGWAAGQATHSPVSASKFGVGATHASQVSASAFQKGVSAGQPSHLWSSASQMGASTGQATHSTLFHCGRSSGQPTQDDVSAFQNGVAPSLSSTQLAQRCRASSNAGEKSGRGTQVSCAASYSGRVLSISAQVEHPPRSASYCKPFKQHAPGWSIHTQQVARQALSYVCPFVAHTLRPRFRRPSMDRRRRIRPRAHSAGCRRRGHHPTGR